jgi:DNA-binding transcriptional ArsR family regulator
MSANVSVTDRPEEGVSRLLSLIGQPARIQILFILGAQEACVCHLETALGMRQASISQHLMVLRKAGLVTTHRDGRHIFYLLARPEVVGVLRQAVELSGGSPTALDALTLRPVRGCPCPHCNPGIDPDLACKNINAG